MTGARATVKVSVYDTPAVIFDALARVIPPDEAETARWVNFTTADGVEVTFFAEDVEVKRPETEEQLLRVLEEIGS